MREAYVWKRQTIAQLAEVNGMSMRSVQSALDSVHLPERTLAPQPTVIAADMTFWGRGYGVLVFRSPTLKKNLWWTESQFETPFVYQEGLNALVEAGWDITGVVIDGKRGVAQVFEHHSIPVQYCQFHQIKTVTKYLTRKPQTDAAQELRALSLTLTKTTEPEFRAALSAWTVRHTTFLNEKSPAPHRKRGWEYAHRRVRAAHRSLVTNLPRLFMYKKYPERNIPNTTNTLDGMFSQIKNRLAVHRGLTRARRFKLVSEVLRGRRN